ncbi:MAG: Lnb N-terminal periplasmic domain-containing protein [Hyphomicrobiales bacterium]
MQTLLKWLIISITAVIIASSALWADLAFWYRLPVNDTIRLAICSLFGIYATATLILLFTKWRLPSIGIYSLTFMLVLAWWVTIHPSKNADWSPDVSRQVTGSISENILTLKNVRDFQWRSDDEFTEQWVTRSYDLNKLRTTDLFLSYWAGPEMAHVIMSFGFDDGKYIAWSIEVRRKRGGDFSPIADLFKSSPLVIVAAEERDVVGVRTNVRGEDVQLYRMRTSPKDARKMLMGYVQRANALSEKPAFYNSLTTNCTTAIVQIARAVGSKIPFDWRLLVNGYLPEYIYENGAVNDTYSLDELRTLSHISQKAIAAGLTDQYSTIIRADVPPAGN